MPNYFSARLDNISLLFLNFLFFYLQQNIIIFDAYAFSFVRCTKTRRQTLQREDQCEECVFNMTHSFEYRVLRRKRNEQFLSEEIS